MAHPEFISQPEDQLDETLIQSVMDEVGLLDAIEVPQLTLEEHEAMARSESVYIGFLHPVVPSLSMDRLDMGMNSRGEGSGMRACDIAIEANFAIEVPSEPVNDYLKDLTAHDLRRVMVMGALLSMVSGSYHYPAGDGDREAFLEVVSKCNELTSDEKGAFSALGEQMIVVSQPESELEPEPDVEQEVAE